MPQVEFAVPFFTFTFTTHYMSKSTASSYHIQCSTQLPFPSLLLQTPKPQNPKTPKLQTQIQIQLEHLKPQRKPKKLGKCSANHQGFEVSSKRKPHNSPKEAHINHRPQTPLGVHSHSPPQDLQYRSFPLPSTSNPDPLLQPKSNLH